MTLTTLFRTLRRDSVSLVTNMTGLSFGLAASILLTLFIQYELSFDRHFSHSGRIYRLNTIWSEGGESFINPINLRQAYTEIPDRVPGIEAAIQIYRGGRPEIHVNENRFKDIRLLYSDPAFFRIFDLDLIHGSPDAVLAGVHEAVITREIAMRFFGKPDVVGESLVMDSVAYMITGVTRDIPANTHFQFDLLMPMKAEPDLERLGGLEFFTYYLLEEGTDHESILSSIREFNSEILTSRFASFQSSTFSSSTEALEELHLHTRVSYDLSPPGNMRTIYIMLTIAVIIMLLALSNFINLYILNGAKRSREIGIRKVNGSSRKRLIGQFYLETFLVVTISFVGGVVLALLLFNEFGRIMQRESFQGVLSTPVFYLMILALYLFTILLSGFYPALLLSRARPIPLIQGLVNPAGEKKALLKIVSVLQIAISIFLLITLVGINTQTRYLKNLSPGYNPDGIVLIHNLNPGLVQNFPAIREALLGIPGVEAVAASGHFIGAGYSGQGIRHWGDPPENSKTISEYRIHPGLCDLYQFRLKAGRFLDPDREPDRTGVLLNEAAVSMLGKTPEEMVGESVVMRQDPMEVIGVLEDFFYESAANSIRPIMLTAYSERIRNIPVRVHPNADMGETLEKIHTTLRSFDRDYVLANRFAAEIYDGYYEDEERLRNILASGSLLSILIVILGFYALVSHQILSRTKEIAIRKVLGGSTREMMLMIFGSSLLWTGIACLVAIPLGWLYLTSWLNDFTMRIPVYWWIFVISAGLVALLQIAISSGQTWSAARKNPVEGLRYE